MLKYIYNLATDKYKGNLAGMAKFFLYLLSLIYGFIVRVLIFIYHFRPYRLNCKVISVGNIILGGTGKTTLVALIAQYLKEEGHKVAIISRGYKKRVHSFRRRRTNLRLAQSVVHSQEKMGDEPYMLKMNLRDIPVLVDADRARAANLAIRDYGADTVILDDGFQQWRLKKDLEIVTIDANSPFGNRNLIPRGILREPLSSLKRPDIFVLTKTNLNPDTQGIKDFLGALNPGSLIIESIHTPIGFYKLGKGDDLLKIDTLKEKTVTLISGIGDPDSFEKLIEGLSINIGLSFRFPDHHPYSQKELEDIIQESHKKNIDTIITTEKDAVRLQQLSVAKCPLPIFILRIRLEITKDAQRFYNRLLRLYSL